MSLKDDLLRNRKIYELLTGSKDAIYEATETHKPPSPPPATEAEHKREPFEVSKTTHEKAETFSLERGKTLNRETGMALKFSPPDGVDFPKLSSYEARSPADPLESLYRQLEVEARRSSQLFCEEEF